MSASEYYITIHNLWLARQRRLLSHGRDHIWILLWDAEREFKAYADTKITRYRDGSPDGILMSRLEDLIPRPDYYGNEMSYRGTIQP